VEMGPLTCGGDVLAPSVAWSALSTTRACYPLPSACLRLPASLPRPPLSSRPRRRPTPRAYAGQRRALWRIGSSCVRNLLLHGFDFSGTVYIDLHLLTN
jgi:hypothetical protein